MDQVAILPLVPLILSITGFLAGNAALVLVLSRYFSTHRIEYVTKQEQEKLRETLAPSPVVGFPAYSYKGTSVEESALTPTVSTEVMDELFNSYLDFNTMPTKEN